MPSWSPSENMAFEAHPQAGFASVGVHQPYWNRATTSRAVQHVTVILHPFLASVVQSSLPMPDPPPVTRAVFLDHSIPVRPRVEEDLVAAVLAHSTNVPVVH